MPQKSKAANYLRAIALAMGGYYFGYYIGIFNPLGTPLVERVYNRTGDAKDDLVGSINLYFTLGAAISVFISGPLADFFGRIRLILFCEVIAVLTCALYWIESVPVLLGVRFLSGIITGINAGIVPVTLTEMFPSSLTGFGGLFFYFALSSHILLGSFANPICGSESDKDARSQCLADNWRYFLCWPIIIAGIRLFLLISSFKFGALESPGYFLNRAKGEELRTALTKWFSTVYAEEYVEQKTEMVIRESEQAKANQEPGLTAMFSQTYRFRFVVVCLLNICQQFSGINFLIFYSTDLFDDLSGNGAMMSLLIGFANVSGALVGMYSIGRYGRRFNLIMGCLLQALSFSTLGMGKCNPRLTSRHYYGREDYPSDLRYPVHAFLCSRTWRHHASLLCGNTPFCRSRHRMRVTVGRCFNNREIHSRGCQAIWGLDHVHVLHCVQCHLLLLH